MFKLFIFSMFIKFSSFFSSNYLATQEFPDHLQWNDFVHTPFFVNVEQDRSPHLLTSGFHLHPPSFLQSLRVFLELQVSCLHFFVTGFHQHPFLFLHMFGRSEVKQVFVVVGALVAGSKVGALVVRTVGDLVAFATHFFCVLTYLHLFDFMHPFFDKFEQENGVGTPVVGESVGTPTVGDFVDTGPLYWHLCFFHLQKESLLHNHFCLVFLQTFGNDGLVGAWVGAMVSLAPKKRPIFDVSP